MSTFERIDLAQFDGHTPGPWRADPTPETLAGGDYQARVIAPGVLPDGATAIITGCPYHGNRNHRDSSRVTKVGRGWLPCAIGFCFLVLPMANIHWPPNVTLIAAAPDLLAALRAAYAEIDRLRASALEWVTVTEDPATLPKGIGAVILVLVGEEWWHQASLGANGDVRRWRLASGKWERLSVGDRWAYIPEVQP